MIDHPYGFSDEFKTFYLTGDGSPQSPSKEFMARFADKGNLVQPATKEVVDERSAAAMTFHMGGTPLVLPPALFLTVGIIEWVSEDEVKVGTQFSDLHNAAGTHMTLRRDGAGGWYVASLDMSWNT